MKNRMRRAGRGTTKPRGGEGLGGVTPITAEGEKRFG